MNFHNFMVLAVLFGYATVSVAQTNINVNGVANETQRESMRRYIASHPGAENININFAQAPAEPQGASHQCLANGTYVEHRGKCVLGSNGVCMYYMGHVRHCGACGRGCGAGLNGALFASGTGQMVEHVCPQIHDKHKRHPDCESFSHPADALCSDVRFTYTAAMPGYTFDQVCPHFFLHVHKHHSKGTWGDPIINARLGQHWQNVYSQRKALVGVGGFIAGAAINAALQPGQDINVSAQSIAGAAAVSATTSGAVTAVTGAPRNASGGTVAVSGGPRNGSGN